MNERILLFQRLSQNDRQSVGGFFVYECEDVVYKGKILELPWKDNKPWISRIPAGEYWVRYRYSVKHKNHFEIMDVPGRTDILIHALNFHIQTTGCVGPGRTFEDIDHDGYIDVTHSRDTLARLVMILPKRFKLIIKDEV